MAAGSGTQQPNFGLDELFGAQERATSSLRPTCSTDLRLTVSDRDIAGGVFLQAYTPTTGTAVGQYADGQVAAVEHTFGKGRTLLIGTMPGAGFVAHPDDTGTAAFFAGLIADASTSPSATPASRRASTRTRRPVSLGGQPDA